MTYTRVYVFLCKKEFFCVRGSDGNHFFRSCMIDLCQTLHDENHQPALVALSAVRGRSQIGTVSLQNNAVQRHDFQCLIQFAVFESQHPADTKYKTFKLQ